ncbi:MAG TPA: AAA family ATPase [Burkholderiaceae bacterium]|nr:AAA family ATPase [Burkholderiaceae bacterium]
MAAADVARWLNDLGLGQYVQVFESNDVDMRTLRHLTDADLAEIGVRSVGHRRRLADAIASLRDRPAPDELVTVAAGTGEAELRQLTVLYAQMVVPQAHAEADPEVLREAIQRFHQTCTRLVAEYDGHVANFYTDCMLVYFGWPRAHEDDAERAALVGLALARQVGAGHVSSPVHVGVRVGIATGPVAVGDLIHEGPAQQQSAVGVTPNLAARILNLAEVGQVAVEELTCRLLGSGFAMHPLGEHVLKGLAHPVSAFAVDSEHTADSRFDALRRGAGVMPMFGRDQELALLQQRWSQASGGEGQAVLLVGEAGIGKSRIASALLEACSDRLHGLVRWQCSPYHTGSALWPVIQRLSRHAGLDAQDSPDTALNKLEGFSGAGSEARALYATLLGLNGAQRYGPLEMTPSMLRERTLELLAEQLFETARQRPLLLLIEDAHWIDPTSLELVERCLEQIERARMLVLITSRPDNQPALAAHPSVTRLSLSRLGRAGVQAIVEHLGGQALQEHTLATILARSDGVPLFVEELTKAVLEAGETAIPASLHGSLMARLDRIPEVKEVAQIAACIGRDFDRATLLAVAEHPEVVDSAIDKLIEAELIFRHGPRAQLRFTFKHALLQAAAYESLLRGKRQAIHARIAQVLEGTGNTPAEILAHHAEGARQIHKAIDCWQRAGRAALAKSAYVEAASYFDNAIALVQAQDGSVDHQTQELELQLWLGQAHFAAHGYGAAPTLRAFTRADALLDASPQRARLGSRVHYGLFAGYATRAELGQALQRATKALAAATSQGTPDALFCAHRMMAGAHMFLGNLDSARTHLDAASALLDSLDHDAIAADFGWDPAGSIFIYSAWALGIQGFAEQGQHDYAQAQARAAELAQAGVKAHVHLFSLIGRACADDRHTVAADAEALAELAAKHGLRYHMPYADTLRRWATVDTRRPLAEDIAAYERSLEKLFATGGAAWIPFLTGKLAGLLAAAGRHQEARSRMERAVSACEDASLGWCRAEVWRLHGEVMLRDAKGDRAEAVRAFERALADARSRGAKLWELRAAVSLGRLLAAQGAPARAQDLLTPLYQWFTEGFDSPDLVAARRLLAHLGRESLSAG